MGILITTSQSHLCGLSLGLAVLLFGVFQLGEGCYIFIYRWTSRCTAAQYGARVIAVINIADGVTGVVAALFPSPNMAFTAAIGYIVDGLAHITLTALAWVAIFEEYEGQLLSKIDAYWVLSHAASLVAVVFTLVITWMCIRATFSYYQVLLVGGTGWE